MLSQFRLTGTKRDLNQHLISAGRLSHSRGDELEFCDNYQVLKNMEMTDKGTFAGVKASFRRDLVHLIELSDLSTFPAQPHFRILDMKRCPHKDLSYTSSQKIFQNFLTKSL